MSGAPEGPPYFQELCAAVEELARLRYLLGEVVALAGAAPDLTDTELRDRLLGLGCRALQATREETDHA